MLTVKLAVRELGVSRRTVWRWIQNTTPDEIHREKARLPDERGRLVPTIVVDVNALRRHAARLLDN